MVFYYGEPTECCRVENGMQIKFFMQNISRAIPEWVDTGLTAPTWIEIRHELFFD